MASVPSPVTIPTPPIAGTDIAPTLTTLLQDLLVLPDPAARAEVRNLLWVRSDRRNHRIHGYCASEVVVGSHRRARWGCSSRSGRDELLERSTRRSPHRDGGFSGAIIAAALIALAIIISSDVRGHALGATGVYAARASVTKSYLDLLSVAPRGETENDYLKALHLAWDLKGIPASDGKALLNDTEWTALKKSLGTKLGFGRELELRARRPARKEAAADS